MNRTTTKKKMAFSLMRLKILLALAFVVPSAMAADDFDAEFSVVNRVYATAIEVTLKFAEEVNFTDANKATIVVQIEDKNGVRSDLATPLTATDVTAQDTKTAVEGIQSDRKSFVFTILAADTDENDRKVHVFIPAGVARLAPEQAKTSKQGALSFDLMGAIPVNTDRPNVVSIQRLRPSSQTVVSAFEEEKVTGAFDVRIVFTEKPHDFKLATINVEGGTASHLVVGVPFTMLRTTATDAATTYRPHPSEGMYEHTLVGVPLGVTGSGNIPAPTGDDEMYWQYRVTITPHQKSADFTLKISVKEFNDGGSPFLNIYKPFNVDYKPNGREQLRLAVATPTMSLGTGVMLSLPHDDDVKITEKQKADATAANAAETVAAEKVKAEAATVAVEKAVDTSVRIPEDGEIYISEIMFAGGGTLPQWIEISNGSRTEQVNLSGWTLMVENATADADVSVGASAKFTIPEGTQIDPSGQPDTPSTILVVTEQGRNNLDGTMADGQVVNLWTDQQLELFRLDIFKRRYSLLSDMAFKITLAPPAALITTPAAADATDVVGNLGADGAATWVLPMAEGNARSSIIRRHVAGSVGPAEPKDGEMMESWVLASDTNFGKPMHLSAHSYYGLPIDVGTPGFRAGGALPVELSHFRPERRKDTGAVVITWSTQSELNNAGFFIKRSRQPNGEFQIINATMIQGAGTTSEKQFYTYTDTTAQANVVYYYQIEDVSLDGNRQTLTRGIRLKGHVGAVGKATTLWGELKRTN